jgi:hypothetical protein
MARSSECTEQYAQKVLDTADFVRDARFRKSGASSEMGREMSSSVIVRINVRKR